MKTRTAVLLSLVLLAVVQAVYYFDKLPDTIATHWGGLGHANAWSTPTQFFTTLFAIEAVCLGWLLIIPFFPKIPDSQFNLPNKDYWLAPERREKTYESIGCVLLNIGIVTQVMFLAVVQMAIQANFRQPPVLSKGIIYVLVAYLVYTLFWCVASFRKYSRTPEH
jgi:uncharacterized membrane protein